MEALTVQSSDHEWVIKIDKAQIPPAFLVKFLKRVRVELLAKKAAFDPSLINLANEMEENWWKKHGDDFLKDVEK